MSSGNGIGVAPCLLPGKNDLLQHRGADPIGAQRRWKYPVDDMEVSVEIHVGDIVLGWTASRLFVPPSGRNRRRGKTQRGPRENMNNSKCSSEL